MATWRLSTAAESNRFQLLRLKNYPQAKAFYQDGPAVFNFVTTTVIDHMKDFLNENQIDPQEIDLVIPHPSKFTVA